MSEHLVVEKHIYMLSVIFFYWTDFFMESFSVYFLMPDSFTLKN